jgi:hypothetical protein
MRRLHTEQHRSIRQLARMFHVNPSTAHKWATRDSPGDKRSAPHQPRTIITESYRAAVLLYRAEHPHHGPIRIAQELRYAFPHANRGTILRILQHERLTKTPRSTPNPRKPIPVGRHRVQMDIQQLPAIEGHEGFEYNISVIHVRTRLKYSEIRPDATSLTLAAVLEEATRRLPPFFS